MLETHHIGLEMLVQIEIEVLGINQQEGQVSLFQTIVQKIDKYSYRILLQSMSRFTDLFQPKPAPEASVVEKKEVVAKSDNVVEISKWKTKKTK